MALASPIGPTLSASASSKDAVLYGMINQARGGQGVKALDLSDRASRMARRHSARMAQESLLFHHGCLACRFPSGDWQALAENVGVAGSLRRVHRAMMRSASHRGNILGGAFDQVGIGVVKKGRRYWVTEIFVG